MHISCPKCNTRFVLLPEQLGLSGRKVRCSQCNTIWHQERIQPISSVNKEDLMLERLMTTNRNTTFAQGVNLPALLPIKIPFYLYGTPVALVVAICMLAFVLFPDYFGLKPSTFYLHKIKDIHIEQSRDIGKITVNYKILNTSKANVKTPLVRVRLLDVNNAVLKSHIVDHSNIMLTSGQYLAIKTDFTVPRDKAKKVDIMVGSRLDFILH